MCDWGIVYCNITAPDNLYAPILLTKTIDGKVIALLSSGSGHLVVEKAGIVIGSAG